MKVSVEQHDGTGECVYRVLQILQSPLSTMEKDNGFYVTGDGGIPNVHEQNGKLLIGISAVLGIRGILVGIRIRNRTSD
jgi:hypothetical protein